MWDNKVSNPMTRGTRPPFRKARRFVDVRNRLRAILRPRGDDSALVFYDERGAEQETIRGLLPVSATLLRMLGDPRYHPEIVGTSAPLGGRPALASRGNRRSA